MTTIKLIELCAQFNACSEAMNWLKKNENKTIEELYASCNRGDWLLWLFARIGIDHKLLVLVACDCAETALKYIPEGEDRPRIAIETARKWCRGEATLEEVKSAGDAATDAARDAAAYAARAAAYAAGAYDAACAARATDAARAAACAARAAAYAAGDAAYAAGAYDAACAARATAYAAGDAAAYAARAAAYAAAYAADLVRKRIPFEVLDALLTNRLNKEIR